MKTSFKWLVTMLLIAGTFGLVSCGGGGGGNVGGGNTASLCAGNSDSFICEVYKVVNNLTSETADPRETDTLTATAPDDTEPTTNI